MGFTFGKRIKASEVEGGAKRETVSPDNAWKALSIIIDWVRHADAKAGATIAAAGVVGGSLFSLVKDQRDVPLCLAVLIVVCAFTAVLGGCFAAWALRPRLWSREVPASGIYFGHISRSFKRSGGPVGYQVMLAELLADNDRLIHEIASQIWANSHIARQKYRWSNIGLMCVLASLPMLAATAVYVGILRIGGS